MARASLKSADNGKRLATRQSVDAAIWSICDIMRRSNCAGALQYVPELTWILFLRILDEREAAEAERAEVVGAEFAPTLEVPYRWQDWAAPGGPKRTLLEEDARGAFFSFVNGELLPHLRGLRERPGATPRQKVISEIMSGVERTRIDTERNFRDILDRVHEISAAGVDETHVFPFTLARFEEFFRLLPDRTDSEQSWTVSLAECRQSAAAESEPLRHQARAIEQEVAQLKDRLAAFRKAEPREEAQVAEAESGIATLGRDARDLHARAGAIEEAVYDLKAVNPHVKRNADTRTPEELLDLIEAKGWEVAEALAALRSIGTT
jgi:hypothetical protein